MDKVIVAPASNGTSVYHTNVECPNVEQIENPQTRSLETLPEHWTECQSCTGDWLDKVQSAKESNIAKRLKDMDPNEL